MAETARSREMPIMIASSLRHSIHTLRRRTSSSVSLAINGLFLLLAWTFLPLENALMSRRAVLFPQIDFKRLKPLDGLRMFVQSVYLLFSISLTNRS